MWQAVSHKENMLFKKEKFVHEYLCSIKSNRNGLKLGKLSIFDSTVENFNICHQVNK